MMNGSRDYIVSHPTGNTFVRALLNELSKSDRLYKYFTTIGVGQKANLILKYIGKRREYDFNDDLISRQWMPEALRLCGGLKQSQEKKRRLADRSYESLDLSVSKQLPLYSPKVIHSYEDGSFLTFLKAKELGIQCSYELPIAHWKTVRRLLAEEADRLPDWEPTLESSREPEEKLARKEQELLLSDCITCPSKFVYDSIPVEIKKQKSCHISPFGSPMINDKLKKTFKDKNKPLKVLFVGSMSQRKGLADLFSALKLLKTNHIKLTVLGSPSMPMSFYRKQFSDFSYLPPCSNKEVRNEMFKHDLLALPSIIEGRALVQQEAMSTGLPIIITPNTGGEDLVEDTKTGFIVPIRSPEKIAEKIEWFLKNQALLKEISLNSIAKAKEFTWENYAKEIVNLFQLS